MVRVGVTGGIGSGKTAFCNILKKHGAYVLNADDLAKKIMAEDPAVKEELVDTFGRDSYKKDGRLNREYLAEQAFQNDRVEELNNIVHPRIPLKTEEIMEKAEQAGYEVFVYEAALLLQNLRPNHLDYIILLLADKEKRIGRVQQRDKVNKELVVDRMEHQQDFSTLKHLADIVIENNGSLQELEEKAERIYYDILTG
ncbi:dephospho-CoA kinase [Balneolaceae bacterium YR4-1]|uniref:Dephospho-CoA kinase n=1 Tax=Halalkalibaculum roseum TaxID=2709311 RepID=A0A6M1SU17_9BACT|nr:dephospho-CoA kinase [Halalkalibaculum roseum]NGP76322.1 dephospho-CoA kinase [Halalkalibaculum roseum]